MATTQESLQVSAIVPSFTVDDLQNSITFYEALGFTVEERWEDKGTLLGVMLRAGKTQIGLSQDDWQKGRDRKKGIGMRLFMSLQSPTSLRAADEERLVPGREDRRGSPRTSSSADKEVRGRACRSATRIASMRVGRDNEEGIVATTQEALQISAIVPSFTVDD